MADGGNFLRLLNSFDLDLKRMDLALRCPSCFKLLDKPVMLPCNHVFCSACIAGLTNGESKCTSCVLPFLHEDLRTFKSIKTFLNIYKNMNCTVSAILQNQRPQDLSGNSTRFQPSHLFRLPFLFFSMMTIFHRKSLYCNFYKSIGRKMHLNNTPVSGRDRDYFKVNSEENIPNIAEENPSILQLHKSLSGNTNSSKTNMEESNRLATEGSKSMNMNNNREEAFLDQVAQPRPPSFANSKDSDTSDQGGQCRTSRSSIRISCEEDLQQVGNEHIEECDNREMKRQKLDSEFDVGCKGGINTMDCLTNCVPEHNKESIPKNQPLHTSSIVGARMLVNCVFCHSFRTTEASGQMQHYLNGKLVGADQATELNVLHVHEKCVDWAPQIYFKDDIIMNLEAELSRASKIKCSSCGKKGAALGCYVKSCRRSYHVPCAYEIQDCRWDCENYLVLCPAHSSHKLPCDELQSESVNKTNHSSSLDLSSPSGDLTTLKTQPNCGQWTASRNWVLCSSALSKEEKELLGKFGSLSGAHVTSQWKPDVTHVIASTDADGACNRTLKFLLAILHGKWVVGMKWIRDCMDRGRPVEEGPNEITHDIHGAFNGPRRGRMKALDKAPQLFFGLTFYLDGYFRPSFKCQLEDLIKAAGGILLKRDELMFLQQSKSKVISPKALVVYNSGPLEEDDFAAPDEAVQRLSKEAAEALACKVGAEVIPHSWILDSIAACNMQLS